MWIIFEECEAPLLAGADLPAQGDSGADPTCQLPNGFSVWVINVRIIIFCRIMLFLMWNTFEACVALVVSGDSPAGLHGKLGGSMFFNTQV